MNVECNLECSLAAHVASLLDQKFGPDLLIGLGPDINILPDLKPEQRLRLTTLCCHPTMPPLTFVKTLTTDIVSLIRLHTTRKVKHIVFFGQLLNHTLQNHWGRVAAAARSLCNQLGALLLLLAALSRDREFALVAVDIMGQIVRVDIKLDTPKCAYLLQMGGLDRLSRLLVPDLTPEARKNMSDPVALVHDDTSVVHVTTSSPSKSPVELSEAQRVASLMAVLANAQAAIITATKPKERVIDHRAPLPAKQWAALHLQIGTQC